MKLLIVLFLSADGWRIFLMIVSLHDHDIEHEQICTVAIHVLSRVYAVVNTGSGDDEHRFVTAAAEVEG